MEKYALLLIALIFVGCDEDLPNQFTSVEGSVTHYYTNEPIPGISIIISENEPWDFQKFNYKILDTLITDSTGYYFYGFYNDTNRYYMIQTLTTPIFSSSDEKIINEGKQNKIELPVKAYTQLELKCYNKTKTFNTIYLTNQSYSSIERKECENADICETLFHIIPEKNTHIQLDIFQRNTAGQIDSSLNTSIEFYSGKNDTTITYYY